GLLGSALSFQHFDLDSQIEKEENSTITDLFASKGEIYFRRKEGTTLQDLIASNDKAVIATGGGTPCYGTVMDDLNNNPDVKTIYLKNNVTTLTERLFLEKEHRPMIAHLQTKELLEDFIRKHLFERSFYYAKATITIECDGRTPEQIVEKILWELF
ncbi:MAG: shikimate kinase, partial [Bacteroidota bacterium]